MVQPLWKRVWQFLINLNIPFPYNPGIVLLGIYPNDVKMYIPTKTLHMNVYSSFIHNCQNLETTKMSFGR